jgi:hypothetical protein
MKTIRDSPIGWGATPYVALHYPACQDLIVRTTLSGAISLKQFLKVGANCNGAHYINHG